MSSNWPTSLDFVPPPDSSLSPFDRAALVSMQSRLQRLFGTQTAATPSAGGTVTPDMSTGSQLAIAMPAGNITVANPTNSLNGDMLTVYITQDSVGARLVTWGNAFRKAVTLSITANALDSITFCFNSSNSTWNQVGGAALAIS